MRKLQGIACLFILGLGMALMCWGIYKFVTWSPEHRYYQSREYGF